MESSRSAKRTRESSLPSLSGVKRPAPSLLPAFEPHSSPPRHGHRPLKRQATGSIKYPTPAPTSSTGILSSSPPRRFVRPAGPLQWTASTPSERLPLSTVPSVELNENGETLCMGRSRNLSQYQLSSNRLISRMHVKARYISATDPAEPNRVEILCLGWNGLKLHCQGRMWDLGKDDAFTSETEGAEIMLDVQEARVMVRWPRFGGDLSDSSWEDSPRQRRAMLTANGSPMRWPARIRSPVSPTPGTLLSLNPVLPDLRAVNAADEVEIYEDASAEEQELPRLTDADAQGQSIRTELAESFAESLSSELSDPLSDEDNDPDEENDPIMHSFGPFGANSSNRFASFNTFSPYKRSRVTNGCSSEETVASSDAEAVKNTHPDSRRSVTPKPAPSTSKESTPQSSLSPTTIANIANHVVNQLAFCRLSSSPLSGILNNLPAEEKRDLTKDLLCSIMESTACIGVIAREGKDAAGKPLESEYYYVPEADTDEHRRLAVTESLRKPSLRNCRKQHKQYYWKKPKTP